MKYPSHGSVLEGLTFCFTSEKEVAGDFYSVCYIYQSELQQKGLFSHPFL